MIANEVSTPVDGAVMHYDKIYGYTKIPLMGGGSTYPYWEAGMKVKKSSCPMKDACCGSLIDWAGK